MERAAILAALASIFFFIFEYVCFNEIVLGKTAHDPHVKPLHKRFMLIATWAYYTMYRIVYMAQGGWSAVETVYMTVHVYACSTKLTEG